MLFRSRALLDLESISFMSHAVVFTDNNNERQLLLDMNIWDDVNTVHKFFYLESDDMNEVLDKAISYLRHLGFPVNNKYV